MINEEKDMPERPRISINQLAKYLGANAPTRRRIIIDQRNPKTFVVNYYELAQQPIVKFLTGGCRDEEIIIRAIDEFGSREAQSEYDETRLAVNADALQAFLESYDILNLDGLAAKKVPNSCPKITIAGVDISVRPEVLLRGRYKGGSVTGAIKLYLAKNDPLTKDSAPYISAVVGRLIAENFARKSKMSERHCQVFDVFAGEAYASPKSTDKRFRDVQYACQEIAMWWNSLDDEE
jgi:hypothetical protein